MNEIEFRQLVERYAAGELLEAEQKQFFELLENEENRRILEEILEFEWKEGIYEQEGNAQIYDVLERHVLKAINKAPAEIRTVRTSPVIFLRKYRLAIAAVLILAVSTTVFFLQKKSSNVSPMVVTKYPTQKVNILPGTNGAILTLDNGQQIVLDSVGSGLITNQGISSIVKQKNGLSYEASGTGSTNLVYNTISTPRGRQYPNLMLSDGTKVWLDAGSSIRFPVAFVGNERKVEITGQVWFDVVHNNKMPFKVVAKGIEITDLGTQFNVNAYDDESETKITLLQGEVKVQNTLMKPGEQARISGNSSLRLVRDVDLEEVTAWKDGYFKFNKADVQTVVRQLSRWYDVDVTYTGAIPKGTFTGKIGRNLTLQEVLDGLAFTNDKFRIEGHKLIVLP